jgi:hypothetical protein
VPGFVTQPARQSRRLLWIVGGGATAIAAATVVVLIIVLGGKSNDPTGGGTAEAAASESPAAESSAEPPPEPEPPALPSGTYDVQAQVTVPHPVWDLEGTSSSETWTIVLACEEAPCSGTLTLSDGSGTADFDGTTMHVTGSRQIVYDCYADDTGELVPGSTLTAHVDFTGDLTASEAGEGERPALAGPVELTWSTVSTTLQCRSEDAGTSTRQLTLSPA